MESRLIGPLARPRNALSSGGNQMRIIHRLYKPVCAIIGHSRDRHRRTHDGIDWRSVCKRCGTPMVKDWASERWIKAKDAPPPP